ncbi:MULTISPECIES: DUF2357 domain-containing protein [unclassified Bacillus (in: firmicutes)]|uniref:DUF2357 domain-containing protein n=1 Tax=unclassified Bacillus (in: firmicutes) TaxID=185979 RepID=UPI0008EB1C7D|nr:MULTISPECIES: DUF2357 domain-containing protein [unclassified Bacillus (in: firmicutes)]SFA69845.1 PD-(D/E)XK nuclease superfamily protein [Bacillus sp. UNCCL13]SFQ59230.1 PD-(D/E)XK nuclease superfamily protein [Bacillus sp. cl95]
MVTQSDFEIGFIQKRQGQDYVFPIKNFFDNEAEFYEKMEDKHTEIIENFETSLTFYSHIPELRLYFDAIEVLPEQTMKMDERGESYLEPSLEALTLFSTTQECYPLIPGFYRLMVILGNKTWYSWVKISPKQMLDTQLEIMKNEVEQELRGLAQDLLMKKTGMGSSGQAIPQSMLEQFATMRERFPSVMAALTDLFRKVNYRITKEYVLVPAGKSRNMDGKSLQQRLMNPGNHHKVKSPECTLIYDLPENRFVKKIISSVSQKLSIFIEAVDRLNRELLTEKSKGIFRSELEKRRTLSELENLAEMAKKMRGAFYWIKTAPWYDQVKEHSATNTSIPHVMHSDSRYRALFQLYRELENEEKNQKLEHSYAYQWKRTDKLYEIWGFIKFIKLLSNDEHGFTPVRGWIFDDQPSSSSSLTRSLPTGTSIEFIKEDWKLQLVYEELLPTKSDASNRMKPLFTRGTNTCPDTRLDVYKKEVYVGSLIIDFKYRPLRYIWDQNLFLTNQPHKTMRQLISYADHLHSRYLFGGDNEDHPLIRFINPVQEVWALFPARASTAHIIYDKDHKVRLLEFTPGFDQSHVSIELKKVLDGLIERADKVRKMF